MSGLVAANFSIGRYLRFGADRYRIVAHEQFGSVIILQGDDPAAPLEHRPRAELQAAISRKEALPEDPLEDPETARCAPIVSIGRLSAWRQLDWYHHTIQLKPMIALGTWSWKSPAFDAAFKMGEVLLECVQEASLIRGGKKLKRKTASDTLRRWRVSGHAFSGLMSKGLVYKAPPPTKQREAVEKLVQAIKLGSPRMSAVNVRKTVAHRLSKAIAGGANDRPD